MTMSQTVLKADYQLGGDPRREKSDARDNRNWKKKASNQHTARRLVTRNVDETKAVYSQLACTVLRKDVGGKCAAVRQKARGYGGAAS